MKYENLALEIRKISGSLILYLYTLRHLSGRSGHQNFLKCLENIGLTKSFLRVWQQAVLLQACHMVCKFLGLAP
jgi:hypothetical protein